jgi:hypothetical protein
VAVLAAVVPHQATKTAQTILVAVVVRVAVLMHLVAMVALE